MRRNKDTPLTSRAFRNITSLYCVSKALAIKTHQSNLKHKNVMEGVNKSPQTFSGSL